MGAWAWNWMEPPLGTISFLILCFQLATESTRSRLGDPLGQWLGARREQQILDLFPKYSPLVVLSWANTVMAFDQKLSRGHIARLDLRHSRMLAAQAALKDTL